MKTAMKLLVASAVLLGYTSCKSFKDLSKQKDGDDVYYSMKDAKKERAAEKKWKEEEEKRKAEEAKQKQAQENNAKAMATSPGTDYYDQPFDYDDYYDYEYAARLRRFNHPVPGSGYYGNYYTNTYYYNYDPYYYGTSVYNSYSFWGPSAYAYNYCPSSYFYYNSGWAWGTGMYYGNPYGYYDPWMNNGWGYNPYYSYYPGWNGGWYGPMTGVYANYWGGPWMGYSNGNGNYGYGNNNYYFNSYDENSYYYGPRHTASASDGRPVGSGGPAFGERFANAIAAENNIENADVRDVNRVTQQTFATSAPAPGQGQGRGDANTPVNDRPVNSGNAAPARDNNTPAAPDYGQQRGNVAAPPQQPSNTTPANAPTPAAPDFNRPTNPTPAPAPAPAPNQSRDNGGSNPAPQNGGSNGGGTQPRGNSGGNNSGQRPR